jgi:hypothetical protein
MANTIPERFLRAFVLKGSSSKFQPRSHFRHDSLFNAFDIATLLVPVVLHKANRTVGRRIGGDAV